MTITIAIDDLPAEQPTISAYACTVPDDCETLHWRGQVLSMNELMSVAQPVVDEEIHVHIEGQDVLTLPLAASGMSAPRFVVHVPAQQPAEQQPVLLDDNSPAYRIGEIGNQIHNLGCEHQNDEELADRLAEIAHQAWMLQRSVMISKQQPAPNVPGLVDSLRQYRHNDGSGLVFGYDKLLVDRHVAGLVEALEAVMELGCDPKSNRGMWALEKAESALAAYRNQGGES